MAISSSLAVKAGAAGTLATAGVGLTGTYFAWDHITLYEVEREVISKDLKLKIENPADSKNNLIKVSVESGEGDLKLSKNYSWFCEITIDPETEAAKNAENLTNRLKKNLLGSDGKANRDLKELLVRGCAKNRKEGYSNKQVTGQLTLNKKEGSVTEFEFKSYPWLDDLLSMSLYEVEEKVKNEEVGLSVSTNETNVTVKVTTVADGAWGNENDSDKYYWECTITVPTGVTLKQDTWQGKLPKNASEKDSNKPENKKKLVDACSKNRNKDASEKKVKAKLDLSGLEKQQEIELIEVIFGK